MTTPPAVDDRLIRWIGIPLFGLTIPQLTRAFAGHGPREPVYYLGVVWFLGLSWLVWHGNRWLLFEQRKHADWFGEPLQKILMLLAGVAFGTVPVTAAMLIAWYRFAGAPTDWRVIEIVVLVNTICVVFVTHVYETVFLIKERESDLVRVERADRARAQAELDALRAQVDPHFLFNSLAALASLVEDQPAQAREFTERLARVYRYLLSSRGRSLVLLGEELAFVDDYARLLAVRFGGALRVVTRGDHVALDRRMVPPVAVQLLLENAVKHNELSATDPLEVVIDVEDRAVSVANARRPRRDAAPSPGVGLRDLAARYRVLAGVSIEIADGASTFAVRVPLLPA